VKDAEKDDHKRGPGRPIRRNEPASAIFRLRIPPGLQASLKDLAATEGLSASEFVLRLIERAVRKANKP
jgi:predicted HicB family RNase H-like nuclease